MRIFSKLLPASKMKLVISSIGVFVLVAFSVGMLYEATKAEVTVMNNGNTETYHTHADTVEELLDEIELTVGKHDALSHSLQTTIENGMVLDYKTAKQVFVTIDGEKQTFFTVADTVGAFLSENQLSFSNRDDISHQADESIADGLEIVIDQAFQVTINDGNEAQQVWTTSRSIQDLLQLHHISLLDNDRVTPNLDTIVSADMVIDITRVEISTVDVEETIHFQTEKRQDNSLEKGKEKVLAEGKNGTIVKTYEVVLENGEEVNRELIDEVIEQPSEDRVIAVGTKEPVNLTTLSTGKEYTMTASAFTAFCTGCSGYTTTGINLKENPHMKVIAVDPNVIPLGTRVWVEGYGEAIAGDTGGAIVGNRIDVHVPTKADAYKWGVRKVKVKILD